MCALALSAASVRSAADMDHGPAIDNCAPDCFDFQYCFDMGSKIADAEKINFSNRLRTSLEAAGIPLKSSLFVRAYNARADGAAVSVHAARKWLHGEAVPSHEKVVVLATWLGVSAAWLRFGDDHSEPSTEAVIPEASISTPVMALMNDITSLPPNVQKSIREIVDVFLRNFDHQNKEG